MLSFVTLVCSAASPPAAEAEVELPAGSPVATISPSPTPARATAAAARARVDEGERPVTDEADPFAAAAQEELSSMPSSPTMRAASEQREPAKKTQQRGKREAGKEKERRDVAVPELSPAEQVEPEGAPAAEESAAAAKVLSQASVKSSTRLRRMQARMSVSTK